MINRESDTSEIMELLHHDTVVVLQILQCLWSQLRVNSALVIAHTLGISFIHFETGKPLLAASVLIQEVITGEV